MQEKEMLDLFGLRLKSARKMAGLSMEDLAQKMGKIITKQAISKYEKGEMKPSSETLIKLAKALDVKPDYFLRTIKIELSALEFRKKSKLSIKKENSLKQRAIDYLERYLELEEILNIKPSFENPISESKINDQDDIEAASKKLREEWDLGLSPICNLLETLEEKGIKVFEVIEKEDFDGLSASVGNAYIIMINKNMPLDRVRFTAAHELGHILCKFPPESEKLCHSFAGAFLLPKTILYRELGKKRNQITPWELKEIKEIYGISMQAIMHRALSLNIISKSYLENFQISMNKMGWKKKEPIEYQGKEESIRFKQLLSRAVAEGIISFSKAAALANISLQKLEKEFQAGL
jgi:Zn-dependent peptidase ImmA (M78 family)/transcriptional regulator with XRE-family HTH domain